MRQAGIVKKTTAKATKPKNRIESPLKQKGYSQEEYFQKVQEVAYHLYIARGCAHGFDVEDWIAAEQIINGE